MPKKSPAIAHAHRVAERSFNRMRAHQRRALRAEAQVRALRDALRTSVEHLRSLADGHREEWGHDSIPEVDEFLHSPTLGKLLNPLLTLVVDDPFGSQESEETS